MNRFRPFLFLLLCLTPFAILAQTNTVLQPMDIFSLEQVTDPQISPDGNKIVYVRNFKDIMTDKDHSNLWIVNSDGSQQRPITQGNQRDHSSRWSNDGKKLAFLSDQQDAKVKLYVYDLLTRVSIAITNSAHAPEGVAWSANDQQLAFTRFVAEAKKSLLDLPTKPEGAQWNDAPIYIDEMNYRGDGTGYSKPGNRQLFTLGLDGGTARQWTFSAHNHGSPVWAKDGKSLLFSANLHQNHELEPINSEIYQLTFSDGSIRALTQRFGPDDHVALSPDGKQIGFTGFDDSFQGYQVRNLYVMNLDGGDVKNLTSYLDRDAENPQWEGNGKGIYFQYDEKGDTKIGHVALTGKIRTITEGLGGLDLGRPYNSGTYTVSKTNRIALTLGGTEHPADLGVWIDGQKKSSYST